MKDPATTREELNQFMYGNVADYITDMPTGRVEELEQFVPLLEDSGADSLHITGANHSNLEDTVPPASHAVLEGEGCFLPLADRARQFTRLPVCGVGKLQSPDYIEAAISAGRIQLVAMSRQLLADPDWAKKVEEGRAETIRRCIYCNRRCVGALRTRQPFGCIFDPAEQQQI